MYRPTASGLSSFLLCVTQSQSSHEGSCLSSKSYIPKSEVMLLCHHSLSHSHMQSAHKHILAGWLWAQLEDPSWPLVVWNWLHSLHWHAGPNLWSSRLRLNLAHRSTTHLALHASHEWLSVPLCVCVCVCRLLVSGGPVPGAGASLCWSHGVSQGQSPWSCHSGGLCPPQTSQLPAGLAYTLQWKRLVEILDISYYLMSPTYLHSVEEEVCWSFT